MRAKRRPHLVDEFVPFLASDTGRALVREVIVRAPLGDCLICGSRSLVTGEKTMSGHDQYLDVGNFSTLAANAKTAAPNEAQLRSENEAAVRTQIDQIKAYAKSNPNGKLVQANRHLLQQGETAETWTAGPGNFSVSSAYGWAIGGGVPFLGQVPLSFLFGGSGDSWKAWATGTAVIMGSFVVDPNTVCLSNEFQTEDSKIGVVRKGPCNFTASGGGVGVSGMTISFYSTGGAYWGTLGGSGAIVGGFRASSI
jgi:hypothetical protein